MHQYFSSYVPGRIRRFRRLGASLGTPPLLADPEDVVVDRRRLPITIAPPPAVPLPDLRGPLCLYRTIARVGGGGGGGVLVWV